MGSGPGDLSGALATVTAGDGEMAWAFDGTGDMDGDGTGDIVFGSWTDDRACLFYGPIRGTLALDDADAGFHGDDDTHFGVSVHGALDVDGGGVPDLVAGASDDGGGAVFVFRGEGA